MKKISILLFAGLLSIVMLSPITAENNPHPEQIVKLSGYGYYLFGQLVSGIYGDEWESSTTVFDHLWINTFLLHPCLTINATNWLTLKFAPEFFMTFPFNSSHTIHKSSYFRTYKISWVDADIRVHLTFDNPVLTSLKIQAGIFPYIFNPDVKTLGNYLFRSTVHPVSIQNNIDYPWTNLLGKDIDIKFFDNRITFETIISAELNVVPFYDYTPAFALYFTPKNEIIDIGGAIAFHHAIKSSHTHMTDSLHKKWKGTKLDFRVIFDPKPLFGGMNFLEKDQFKIYAELAFLGLEDKLEVDTSNLANLRSSDPDTAELKNLVFPANSLIHRMPFMIGINFPTWKILDLLALELEWFYSPYANDWFGKFDSQKAEARQPSSLTQWDNYINKDNFKWSLYMKKSFGKFEAKTILGNDHTIYTMSNLQVGNFEQTMKRPKDWHWFVELRYNL
jgi:hypothetical protein